jgi:hypothetical protein
MIDGWNMFISFFCRFYLRILYNFVTGFRLTGSDRFSLERNPEVHRASNTVNRNC